MEQRRAAILELSAHGKTPTEIARDLGCDRSTVYRVVARGTSKASHRSREKPERLEDKVEAVRKAVEEKRGKVTIRGLAREFSTSRRTMDRLVKEDLGLKSYKRTPRQALKPSDCEKRMARSKILINKLKHKPRDVVILFSDETPFSLGEMVASDTGFYLAEARATREDDVVHISKERHYANLQVLAVIGSDGQKCDLVFLESNERLTAETYTKYLQEKVFPWARRTYGDKWWWQQDGASCHTATSTQEFLQRETPAFFDKNSWPPHSPDLSPLDYAVFGHLKGMLSGTRYRTKEQLKAAIIAA